MKKLFLGILIGIGLIIPGVSCASMAVIFNIYDDFLDVTSGFYRPKIIFKHFLFIIGLIIGILSILLFLMNYYFLFKYAIEGLFMSLVIVGTIKYQKRIDNPALKNPLSFVLVGILLVIFLKLLLTSINFTNNHKLMQIALIGFIASIALVIPGISGGLILLSFGIYFKLIAQIKLLFEHFPAIFEVSESLFIVLTFCLSLVFGSIFFSTILKKFLKSENYHLNNFILGIMLASIFLMFVESSDFFQQRLFFLEYALGIIIGLLLSKLIWSIQK